MRHLSTQARRSARPRSPARLPTLALLAALVTGCSTVQVSAPPPPPPQAGPETDTARAAHWRFDAGNRPPADRDGYRPPLKLAVLLPLSGGLATASAPVRDGLLAGYYGENRRRPELVFYDTAGTAAGALSAYARAVAEGADQVLGPLGRDEVSAVFRGGQVTVPLIALNRGVATPPTNNASFALAPEDDGIAAADFLLSREARNVLVLDGGDDSARRSIAAFRERLQARGGRIAATVAVYGDATVDQTPALQAAAQAQGGVDGVFLALGIGQARAMAPQLALAGLSGKPRVAPSQLGSGGGGVEQNRVLDGIAFPSEAWTAGGLSALPSAGTVASQLPTARGAAARLFAFGYDAWQLTAYLEHLALGEAASVRGATGVLRIDPSGNVLRTPAWSTYSGGSVVRMPGG